MAFQVERIEDPEDVQREGWRMTCHACRWTVYLPPQHQDLLGDLMLRHIASNCGKRVGV